MSSTMAAKIKALEEAHNVFCYIANHAGDTYGTAEHMRPEDYKILSQVSEAAAKQIDAIRTVLEQD